MLLKFSFCIRNHCNAVNCIVHRTFNSCSSKCKNQIYSKTLTHCCFYVHVQTKLTTCESTFLCIQPDLCARKSSDHQKASHGIKLGIMAPRSCPLGIKRCAHDHLPAVVGRLCSGRCGIFLSSYRKKGAQLHYIRKIIGYYRYLSALVSFASHGGCEQLVWSLNLWLQSCMICGGL